MGQKGFRGDNTVTEWHLYKALNYEGKCIGIVLAQSRPLADAYWMGQKCIPHSVVEINVPEDNHPWGVVPILVNRTIIYSEFGKREHEIIILENP